MDLNASFKLAISGVCSNKALAIEWSPVSAKFAKTDEDLGPKIPLILKVAVELTGIDIVAGVISIRLKKMGDKLPTSSATDCIVFAVSKAELALFPVFKSTKQVATCASLLSLM